MAQLNEAQQQQVQAQMQRIRNQAAISGTRPSEQEIYRQAVIDVAGANQLDPNAVLAANPMRGRTQSISGFDYNTIPGALQGTEQAQQNYLEQQQQFNRLDETGPYGGARYRIDPATGRMTREYFLSPNQSLLNAQQEERDLTLGGLAKDQLGQIKQQGQYSLQGMPDSPQALDTQSLAAFYNPNQQTLPELLGGQDLLSERQRIEGTLYDNFSRRMEPQFARQQERLEMQLANEGIPRGSERYNESMRQLQQQQNDARLNAQAQATQLGGQEQQRLFGMSSDARGQLFGEGLDRFGVSAEQRAQQAREQALAFGQQGDLRRQGIAEYEAQRYAPMREFGSALQGMRGVMQPQYSGISQVNPQFIDPSTTALAGQKLAQDYELAQMSDATRRYLSDTAHRPFTDMIGLEQLRFQNQQALNAQRFGFDQIMQDNNRPPSYGWGDALGTIGASAASGAGNAFGQSFGSSAGSKGGK